MQNQFAFVSEPGAVGDAIGPKRFDRIYAELARASSGIHSALALVSVMAKVLREATDRQAIG